MRCRNVCIVYLNQTWVYREVPGVFIHPLYDKTHRDVCFFELVDANLYLLSLQSMNCALQFSIQAANMNTGCHAFPQTKCLRKW